MWARVFPLAVSIAFFLPLLMSGHMPSYDETESPLFSETGEPAGDEPFPILEVTKQVQPSIIYPMTAPPGAEPRNATVTLKLTGSGQPANITKPQDTVFLIDTSGSMCDMPPHSDCGEIRIDSVKQYIDTMGPEDRGAIVAFGKDCLGGGFEVPWGAWVVPDWGCAGDEKALHLTYMDKKGKEKLKDGAETLRWSNGSTNIEKAISLGNWELIPGYKKRQTCLDYTTGNFPLPPPGGDANHTWVQILLTDGEPSHFPCCVEEEIQDAINAGIRIYTIGLGPEANETFLKEYISDPTGGKYYFADAPEDLPAIYAEIANEVEDRAFRPLPGIEPEVIDAVPKNLNPKDFFPAPTEITDGGNHWLVKWDVNETIRIGDSWQASYVVSSDVTGVFDVTVYGTAKVQYTAWNENRTETPIPSAFLEVSNAVPPRPPRNLNAVLSGLNHEDVRIFWDLSEDDSGPSFIVHQYEVYRGDVYDSFGTGYVLYDSVPKGTIEYVDVGAGEGDAGNHFYYVCSVDIAGLQGCTLDQAGKFARPLASGLNLVSIPLIQWDESVTTVLQTVEFQEVWTYDSSSKKWKWWMGYKPYLGELRQVSHTMGVWINVTEDSNLTVAGIVPLTTSIQLRVGWNLIGYPSFSSTYSIASLRAEMGVARVEGFNPSTSPYFLRALGDGDILWAGYGYWINSATGGVWTISSS